jgi:hypothetical protein
MLPRSVISHLGNVLGCQRHALHISSGRSDGWSYTYLPTSVRFACGAQASPGDCCPINKSHLQQVHKAYRLPFSSLPAPPRLPSCRLTIRMLTPAVEPGLPTAFLCPPLPSRPLHLTHSPHAELFISMSVGRSSALSVVDHLL